MAGSRVLRVLVLKEGTGPGWAAQCLEYDIAAQGCSIKKALENFREVFEGQIALDLGKGREPLSSKKQAPPWYWRALEEAEPLKNPVTLNIPKRSWFSSGVRIAEAFVRGT